MHDINIFRNYSKLLTCLKRSVSLLSFFTRSTTIDLPKRSTMSQVLPLAPREIGLRDSTATSQSTEVHSRQPGDTGLRRSPRIRFHARQITCEAFPQIGFATFSESLASPPRRGEMQGREGRRGNPKKKQEKNTGTRAVDTVCVLIPGSSSLRRKQK